MLSFQFLSVNVCLLLQTGSMVFSGSDYGGLEDPMEEEVRVSHSLLELFASNPLQLSHVEVLGVLTHCC